MLYRLAASPGRRALLGLPARRGPLIRPLLGFDRAQVRALAEATELPFADDPTNDDPRFARNRIRNEVMPVLRELNPAIERNIAETQSELGEEAAIINDLVASILEQAGIGSVVSGPVVISTEALLASPRRCADSFSGPWPSASQGRGFHFRGIGSRDLEGGIGPRGRNGRNQRRAARRL